ncbi:uncharacterized protein [Pseudorasbora parva]|uniref:uncharacterized protein n=1 Tax=Pseudorasbora parva TaxID=51549 RepID=UPI00351DB839
MFLLFLFLSLFVDDVSGAETDEMEVVMEGDFVNLPTQLAEIKNDDTILWMFGPKDSAISQLTRKDDFTSVFFTDNERFRDRLQVDQKTGSLTIRNTRIRHSGQYKLSISRQKTTIKIFNVTVIGMVGETDGVKSVSVTEGESVTLQTDVEVQRDVLIVWRFGDKGILLAKIDVETNETSLNDDDERFRERLKLDQTGSLTIRNTKTEHSGLYEVQIRGRESSQRFLLSVTAVPDPGLSPGAVAGIVIAVLLVAAVLAAVVIYYRRKISELQNQMVEEKKSVIEGDSVTLQTSDIEKHKDDQIQWYYEEETNLIAEINKETNRPSTRDGADGRFRSKLQLDAKTGSLTITDIRTIHSGLYELKISSSRRTKYKRFTVSVNVKTVPVTMGGSVRLETDTKIQSDDLILWTFGAEKSLVAKNATKTDKTDDRFTDRVQLDKTTGSLTITNIQPTDSGHYKLQIINNKQTTHKRFNVKLTDSTGSQVNEYQAVDVETHLL